MGNPKEQMISKLSTFEFGLDKKMSVCVCVCVCVRERERERERERLTVLILPLLGYYQDYFVFLKLISGGCKG